jgi:hypothetical protein
MCILVTIIYWTLITFYLHKQRDRLRLTQAGTYVFRTEQLIHC